MNKISIAFAAATLAATSFGGGYDWQKPHAKILPNGELAYAPEAWTAPKFSNARYIDFDKGDDNADGRTPATAWKHHPNDPAASGKAKANPDHPDAYVFKRGVIYRGRLQGSLKDATLTSMPGFGKGKAVIAGADSVPRISWKKAAHPRMPEGAKVWSAKLDRDVRAVWCRAKNGEWQRLTLARTPNWTYSNKDDVMDGWWQWEQPEWWTDKNKVQVNGKKMHLGIDSKHLKGLAAEDLVGGLVWSEWGIVMGTPFASRIESYDASRAGIGFQGFWYGDSEKIITKNRYFLEDRPAFLDEPGEFWCDPADKTLYARFPKDADPHTLEVDASNRCIGFDFTQLENVRITALDFERIGPHVRLDARPFEDGSISGGGIRVYGSAVRVTIDHCGFKDVNTGIRVKAQKDDQTIDELAITDNRIEDADQDSIQIAGSQRWGKSDGPYAYVGKVDILRNWIHRTGMRPARSESGHSLAVNFAERLHLAGNFVSRTCGAGIFVFVGKGDGDASDCPYARALIHHNRVEDPLLMANDWGGIETWQGGPTYVWGNISRNPGGYWNWAAKQDGNQRLGFAYYLDGGFKTYHFDNQAIGNSSDITSKLCNGSALYQATPTVLNAFYNGLYRTFARGSGWNPQGGRHVFAGNRFEDISVEVFNHKTQKEDAGHEYGGEVLKDSIFMVDNGLPDNPKAHRRVKPFIPWSLSRTVGEYCFRQGVPGLDEHWYMSRAMRGRFDYWKHPRNDLVMPADAKVVKGGTEDWIPSAVHFAGEGAKLKGRAVSNAPKASAPQPATPSSTRKFKPAPWVEIALPAKPQWGADLEATFTFAGLPAELKGQKLQFHFHWLKTNGWGGYLSHIYLSPTVNGDGVIKAKLINLPKGDYPADFGSFSCLFGLGPDLDHCVKRADFTFDPGGVDPTPAVIAASDTAEHPQAVAGNNLCIEAVFATRGAGTVVTDLEDGKAGFTLAVAKSGKAGFRFAAGGESVSVASSVAVNDGAFHHVLGEIDRKAGKANVYVDGKLAGSQPLSAKLKDADASTDADLLVGRDFTGDVDFLRIAHSSLAESHTTIDELYTWEFAGPFLR